MAEFGLVKSFDIDNGQLDSVSQQQAFVLGYELAQIDGLLAAGVQISRPVHGDNFGRIEKSCNDANRSFKLTWSANDSSESWMQLEVEGGPSKEA